METIKLIKSADFKVEDINVDLHKRIAAAQGHITSRHSMDTTREVIDFRDTSEVCSEMQEECERLLKPDGTPRDRCNHAKSRYKSILILSILVRYLLYSCHKQTLFL